MVTPIDIAFHMGAHKTATTHLQRYLTRQRADLRAAGCIYFGPGQTRHRGVSFNQQLGLGGADARNGQTVPAYIHRLTRGRRLLLSEENYIGSLLDKTGVMAQPMLYEPSADRIARFVKIMAPHRVHLFYAVRDPAGFLLSSYSQSLMGGTVWPWEEFLADVELRDVDWAELVAAWSEKTNAASITIWRYEDYSRLAADIVARLAGVDLGMTPLTDWRAHAGLSAKAVTACLEWHAQGHRGRLGGLAREDFPVNETNPAFDPWSAEERKTSAEIYAQQIQAIKALPNVAVLGM